MAASARKAPVSPSDADVIASARKGDHEAFRVLVERYQERAYRLALRVLRDEEAARDVVQEGFLKVYRSLDRFEGRSSFYTWLYRVVMNLCLDAKRRDRSGRHAEWDETVPMEVDPGGADAVTELAREHSSPSGQLERKELRAVVADAIEKLPDDARQTLVLREVEGLSYAEIAKCLGVPKGTVMSRLHNARKRVKEILLASGRIDASGGLAGLASEVSAGPR
jgi:RNA polymerase sigma-70 factor (ECF subfamily)